MERLFQGYDWYRDFGQADGCFQAAFPDSGSLVGKLRRTFKSTFLLAVTRSRFLSVACTAESASVNVRVLVLKLT